MRKKITKARNKPIRKLKERMRFGQKSELCAFCGCHFEYLSLVGYRHEIYECVFIPQIKEADPCHSPPARLLVGDYTKRSALEKEEPDKGAPCLKSDWLECPFRLAFIPREL